MSTLRTAATIAAHDLAAELRRPVAASAVLLFGACSLVVLRLALGGGARLDDSVLAGALWVVLVFAALVGTSRAWAAEREDGAWDALLQSPASRVALHLGKVGAAIVTTLVLDAVLLALYLALFGGPGGAGTALLVAAIALATVGFGTVGVLVAALSLRASGRDLLGAAIFLPLAIPLVIAAVSLSLVAFDAGSDSTGQLLAFLVAYDATFLVAGIAAFPELAVE
ncbi:MAG: heme exporter protein CcmB [Thermoleophilia bacterium]|nr:heme exporter protein CcmB [Thermoleophilia bacterium]